MSIEKKMKENIAWQYQNCDFVNAYVEAVAAEFEELFAVAAKLDEQTSLDKSRGRQQDLNGEILNTPRPVINNTTVSDDIYRKLLYAKAGQNVSKALVNDIGRVFSFMADADQVFIDSYKDRVIISYVGPPIPKDQKQAVTDAIRQTTRCGVKVLEITRINNETLTFGGPLGGNFAEREI